MLFLGGEKRSSFIVYESYKCIVGYPRYSVSLACRQCGRRVGYRCYNCRTPIPGTYPRYRDRRVHCFKANARGIRRRLTGVLPRTGMVQVSISAADEGKTRRGLLSRFRSKRTSVLLKARVVTGNLSFPGVALMNMLSTSAVLRLPSFQSSRGAFRLLARMDKHTKERRLRKRMVVRACAPRRCDVRLTKRRSCSGFCRERVVIHGVRECPPFCCVSLIAIDRRRLVGTISMARGVARCVRSGLSTRDVILNPITSPVPEVGGECQCRYLVGCGQRPRLNLTLGGILSGCRRSVTAKNLSISVSLGPCVLVWFRGCGRRHFATSGRASGDIDCLKKTSRRLLFL